MRVKRFYSPEARDAYEAGCSEKNRYKAAKWFSISGRIEKSATPTTYWAQPYAFIPLCSSIKVNEWER